MAKNTRDADVAFVKALAELLRENELTELEVTRDYASDDSLTVRVARQENTIIQSMSAAPVPAPAAQPVAAAPSSPAAPAAPAAPASDDPAQHPGALSSPMVGTCYLQPEPGSDAFVSVGDTVKEGQTVIIIEAMKTMNQIPAPRSGKVTRILVEDGSPVEFGAPLMIIE